MSMVERLRARVAVLPPGRRIVAVAGPPGAGKSTLAAALVAGRSDAALVEMDGFHLDNPVLEARGLMARKGAPETFDADGFVAAVARLRAGGEVVLPAFDRGRDLAVAGARVVPEAARILVVEGNYLLLDRAPWDALLPMFDLTVSVDPGEEVIRDRLIARWRGHGLDEAAALARAEGNDLPNAALIRAESVPAQVTLGVADGA